MRRLCLVTGAALLAACSGGEAEQHNVAAPAPTTLPAGQWEVTAKTTALKSTDKTTPLIKTAAGDVTTASACVGADGAPPAKLFAFKGDQCTVKDSYVRNGRMSVQLDCTRSGAGKVMGDLNGNFTADSMTGALTLTSFFTGSGDYELRQEITGRRVGECAAAAGETKTADKSLRSSMAPVGPRSATIRSRSSWSVATPS